MSRDLWVEVQTPMCDQQAISVIAEVESYWEDNWDASSDCLLSVKYRAVTQEEVLFLVRLPRNDSRAVQENLD